ncbi:hypothetical protein EYE40_09210 [Glaciihabitans arcticus]|uniref:Uncharacterized protein n=1 Tax=Glaciihabitans arcticus TaxID=2668039 RepID=A0A4Q9GRI1_9MICO|nr:hypothetical protein EYE40_09210 [Glaciihabitans arcticus]
MPWRLFWLDALIPLASTVLAIAVWLIAPGALSEIFARNLAASYGLAMIAFAVGAGRYAFIAPAGYLVAAMLLGFGPLSFGEPDAWAAIVAVNEDEVIRLAALAVFGLGFTALFVRSTIRWALR